jgi:hypothetical protein
MSPLDIIIRVTGQQRCRLLCLGMRYLEAQTRRPNEFGLNRWFFAVARFLR